MSDGPKVVPLGAKNELAGAISKMERDVPVLIGHAILTAKIKRAYYEALVREGFTEGQALQLCMASMYA